MSPVARSSAVRPVVGLIVALAICFAAAGIGGLLTSTSVGSWYLALERPAWTPPGWVFGPVWSALYAAMAVAAWLVWRGPAPSRRALTLFGVQLALNVAWSGLFFGLRSPGIATVEILVLLAAIIWTAIAFARHSRVAAVLMVPYGLWVAFASALCGAIWWLNR